MISIKKPLTNLIGIRAGHNTRIHSINSIRTARSNGVSIGRDSIIHCRFSLDRSNARISIGNRCYIGRSHIVSAESVVIEDDVIISWGVTIVDHNSHALNATDRSDDIANWHLGKKDWSHVDFAPVIVEKAAWLGFNAIVLKGVTIGRGSVVGAGAVVTKDVPAFTAVAGNPAKIVRELENLHSQ